ncbi:MAG: hypothetical protein ACYTE6_12365 [Planctomycetota bacterium]|jgi:hypothetical protein
MSVFQRSISRRSLLIAVIVVVAAVTATKGCMSPRSITNRNPIGEIFPTVSGQSLEQAPVTLPQDLAGAPAVLLVGYAQKTQFDIDRWLMGLLQAEVDARIVEVPAIPGLVPTIASKWIDDGMRAGIPREDWASVVTLYGGAAKPVAALTGTEFPQRTRVLVLDATGTIVWFDDEGYSARKAMEIGRLVSGLGGA